MLQVECLDHLDKVREFAKSTGRSRQLEEQLDYLAGYACHKSPQDTRCLLYPDFAPYSFYFVMERKEKDQYRRWFVGGVIFHGPHDHGGTGEAPTFSVCLEPTDGWSIHT